MASSGVAIRGFKGALAYGACCRLIVALLGVGVGWAQALTLPASHKNFATCPQGWIHTASGGCLLLVVNGSRVSWDVAEQNCVQQGGHLASPSALSEWQEVNATCAASAQADCWFGARQLLNQATPSAGWYWQDCMAQRAVPFDTLVPSAIPWRGVIAGTASTAEPNDYNSTDGSFGPERNNENCAKWEGGQMLDYACGMVLPITPTAYVCSKSRYCGLNATSVNTGGVCSCVCLPGFSGDGQTCKPCDPSTTGVASTDGAASCQLPTAAGGSLAVAQPPRNVCASAYVESPPAGNIVSNDFSNGIPFNWFCPFCAGTLVNRTDSTGSYVVATAEARGNRTDAAVGVQVNNLQANQTHYFSAWVRTQNAVNQTNRGVIVFGSVALADGSFRKGPFCMAPVAQIQNDCWSLVVGAFTPPTSSQMIRISIDDPSADIHVLGVAVVPRTVSDVRKAQNATIEQWRKTNLQLSFRQNGSPVSGTFDLEPLRSGYIWGMQDLDVSVISNPALQNFVLNIFQATDVAQLNWGWPAQEPAPDTFDYSSIEGFIAWAHSNNLSVYGPQITWDDLNNGIPRWVQEQVAAGADLDRLIAEHSIRAMKAGNGRYTTVTVDNEGIHNTYIPTNANGTDSIVKCFTEVRNADLAIGHNTPITFNEYNVGESCYYNFPLKHGGDPVSPDDYARRVNFLNAQGNGQLVNVAGLQFQVTPNQDEAQRMSIGIDYIHNRTGLPIQVTEFNINTNFDTYPNTRTSQADLMETSLRQLFANRHVEAIMFQHMLPYPWGGDSDATCASCMFDSKTFEPNLAGERYLRLRQEWSTKVVKGAVNGQGSAAQFRAFHGTYKLTFTDSNGKAAPSQTVTVENDNGANSTQSVVINI